MPSTEFYSQTRIRYVSVECFWYICICVAHLDWPQSHNSNRLRMHADLLWQSMSETYESHTIYNVDCIPAHPIICKQLFTFYRYLFNRTAHDLFTSSSSNSNAMPISNTKVPRLSFFFLRASAWFSLLLAFNLIKRKAHARKKPRTAHGNIKSERWKIRTNTLNSKRRTLTTIEKGAK